MKEITLPAARRLFPKRPEEKSIKLLAVEGFVPLSQLVIIVTLDSVTVADVMYVGLQEGLLNAKLTFDVAGDAVVAE